MVKIGYFALFSIWLVYNRVIGWGLSLGYHSFPYFEILGEIWLVGYIEALVRTPALIINFVMSETVFVIFPVIISVIIKLVLP